VGRSGGEQPRHRFDCGVVRGVGSAAFVDGAIATAPVVAGAGLATVIWGNAGLLLTLSSGLLQGNLGAAGSVIAALCALALPTSFTLATCGAGAPIAEDGDPRDLAADRCVRTAVGAAARYP
jgi:hypothetical protein